MNLPVPSSGQHCEIPPRRRDETSVRETIVDAVGRLKLVKGKKGYRWSYCPGSKWDPVDARWQDKARWSCTATAASRGLEQKLAGWRDGSLVIDDEPFAIEYADRQRRAGVARPEPVPRTSEVARAYHGSDPVVSRRVCAELERIGHLGRLAASLFRAQKASTRAKRYRGGPDCGHSSYRTLAYERKGAQLAALVSRLSEDSCGYSWGWTRDAAEDHASWVVYLDLPMGQVSFHSVERLDGPDYPGQWDGQRASEARIILFCQAILGDDAEKEEQEPESPADYLSKPDWEAIEGQLALYAYKDGLPEREVRRTMAKMQREYERTRVLPPGWERYIIGRRFSTTDGFRKRGSEPSGSRPRPT